MSFTILNTRIAVMLVRVWISSFTKFYIEKVQIYMHSDSGGERRMNVVGVIVIQFMFLVTIYHW